MSCKIYTFPSFEREAKRLNKRYKWRCPYYNSCVS